MAGALDLLERRLAPVLLRTAGERIWLDGELKPATGKEPRFDDYAETAIAETEDGVRHRYGLFPTAGVGVYLGLRPAAGSQLYDRKWEDGVADVEVDDPDAAQAPLERIFRSGIPETLRFLSSGAGRMHRIYRLTVATANRLVAAGVCTAVIKDDPSYPGLEIRMGSLRSFKKCHSVCPPTATLRKDVTLGPPREWIEAPIADLPEELVIDLIERCEAGKKERARREERAREDACRQALRDEPVPLRELRGKSPLERFIHALSRMELRYEKTASGAYKCSCTSSDHEDRNPSMTFEERPDGRLSVTCWSWGCTLKEIMEGVGLNEIHRPPAFPLRPRTRPPRARRPTRRIQSGNRRPILPPGCPRILAA